MFEVRRQLRRFKALASNSLFGNSMYLILSSFVVAGTGFFFWMVVARLYSTTAVGIASALVSAMGFIAMVSKLGFEISLVRYLPETEQRTPLINSAITSAALIATVVATGFVLTVEMWSSSLAIINDGIFPAALFIVVTIAETVRPIQMEGVFIGLKRAKYAFLQMTSSIVRIGVAFAFIGFGSLGIYTAFGTTAILAVLLGGFFTMRLLESYQPRPRLDFSLLQRVFRYSAGNYLARTAEDLLGFLLPILVLQTLGAEANAYFFIAWQMASLLVNVPQWTTRSLLAEGAHDESRLWGDAIHAIKITLGILCLGVIGVILFGQFALSLFGVKYANQAYLLLIVLAVGTLPFTLTSAFAAVKRVQKDVKPVIYVYSTILILTLGGTYLSVQRYHLLGVGLAWLIANLLVGSLSAYGLWQDFSVSESR